MGIDFCKIGLYFCIKFVINIIPIVNLMINAFAGLDQEERFIRP